MPVCITTRKPVERLHQRRWFARSRTLKKNVNDADRLRKYLAKFDLDWGDMAETGLSPQ